MRRLQVLEKGTAPLFWAGRVSMLLFADRGQSMIRQVSGKIVTPSAELQEKEKMFLAPLKIEVVSDSRTAVAAGGEVTPTFLQDHVVATVGAASDDHTDTIAVAAASKHMSGGIDGPMNPDDLQLRQASFLGMKLSRGVFLDWLEGQEEIKKKDEIRTMLETGELKFSKLGNSFFLDKLVVKPHDVLGKQKNSSGEEKQVAASPDNDMAIFDAAELSYITNGNPKDIRFFWNPKDYSVPKTPIYALAKITDFKSIPEDVRSAITTYGQAKFHAYPSTSIVHLVGPKYSDDCGYPAEQLVPAYQAALQEAAGALKANPKAFATLRLQPLSPAGSSDEGRYENDMEKITVKAIDMGFERLGNDEQQALLAPGLSVELCISLEDDFQRYQQAVQTWKTRTMNPDPLESKDIVWKNAEKTTPVLLHADGLRGPDDVPPRRVGDSGRLAATERAGRGRDGPAARLARAEGAGQRPGDGGGDLLRQGATEDEETAVARATGATRFFSCCG
eukprot:CAMPEP_0178990674 /NCGR_PEP_ID=MMETSP0795-20121207/5094_1 /TAXON_ID=88552 /ORGANISM="Amoebophrya sp., Strain Ameob2" /LENGTH=503 /DNA_ID=CAMNT_0020682279 /DNA_START=427 /DNA_END=1938 /DNA_ORIENTATION=+